MKTKAFFLFALLLLIMTVPARAGVPEGTELAKLITGKWSISNDKPAVQMTTDYKGDGTFVMVFSGLKDEKPFSFTFEGKWQVSDRTITRTITKTTLEEALKIGDEEKLEIVEIDSEHLKYEVSGKTMTETRIKEQAGGNKSTSD